MPEPVLAAYAPAEEKRIVDTLFEWLRIPSISADPSRLGDLDRSAEFCAKLMNDAGLGRVDILQTGGGPAVYGEWCNAGPDAPTVLVYGHHDVQPVDPLEEWTSPPFEPVIIDGECRARGAIDDKGQTLYQIEAARALLAERGELPVNLKILVEGEEEVGSPNFESLLKAQAERLGADVVVVSDTGMISPEVPSTTVGMRGLVAFDVSLRTASIDLHSGMWGGTVPTPLWWPPAWSLPCTTGTAKSPSPVSTTGCATSPQPRSGPSTPSRSTRSRSAPPRAASPTSRERRATAPWRGIGVRPTAEVVGVHSGYGGPGIKTIVPATAGFKVAFRLVPDQRPEEVEPALREWLRERLPAGVDVEVTAEGSVAPALTPVDHPAVAALAMVIERIWGRPPLYTREGGSGPEEALGRVLGAPVLFLGVGLPGDRIHAPNERMVMDQFWKGLLAAGELLLELGRES
jgi:acetylornithine deacetylase/succinyl-diaminopimelate desuccinylase-like protein